MVACSTYIVTDGHCRVLWEEDGWAREEEEQTMRCEEDEEEDAKLR